MESLRAVLVGVAAGFCLFAPTLFFFRRDLVVAWQEVFGVVPQGTVSSVPRRSPAALIRFRRTWPTVVLWSATAIISALVSVGSKSALASALSACVCLIAAVSLGLHILAHTLETDQSRQPPSA